MKQFPIKLENSPLLCSSRLVLRRFSKEDAPALLEIISGEETNTFLPWFPLKKLSEAESFLEERFLAYYLRPWAFRYALCLKEDNKPIGYVWLACDESFDFGYGLRKEFWHQGLMSEAAGAVFEQIKKSGIPYITATHDILKPRSGAVMKKLGMSYQYSFTEQWQPKDKLVAFRMYQLSLDGKPHKVYSGYQKYPHFIEETV